MDYIYVVRNAAMPDLLKVGFTGRDYLTRISELSNTSVPFNYELLALFLVRDGKNCEQRLHEVLNAYRVDKNREFFRISLFALLRKSAEIISGFAESDVHAGSHPLNDTDRWILNWIFCGKHGQKNPTYISTQLGIDVQTVISRLYRLAGIGLIKEHLSEEPEWAIWTILHPGREYLLSNSPSMNE